MVHKRDVQFSFMALSLKQGITFTFKIPSTIGGTEFSLENALLTLTSCESRKFTNFTRMVTGVHIHNVYNRKYTV